MPFLKYTWAIIMRSLVIRRRVRPSFSFSAAVPPTGNAWRSRLRRVHCVAVFIGKKIPRLAEFLVDLQIQRDCLGVGLVREPDEGHELGVLFGRQPFVAGGRAGRAMQYRQPWSR